MNESVKQVNVLTEEEMSHRSYQFYSDYIGSIMTPISYKYTEEIIKSHRTLNSRNADLVHENDELMAENEKLIKERDKFKGIAKLFIDGDQIELVHEILNMEKPKEELNHE